MIDTGIISFWGVSKNMVRILYHTEQEACGWMWLKPHIFDKYARLICAIVCFTLTNTSLNVLKNFKQKMIKEAQTALISFSNFLLEITKS